METTIFKGYKATITNDAGQSSPCWVCNESENMQFNDGTSGPALKVQTGVYYRSGGWSGGAGKLQIRYSSQKIWVRASRVS